MARLDLRPDATITWNPTLSAGAVVRGRLRGPQGTPPLAEWEVWLVPVRRCVRAPADQVTGEDGSFTFRGCANEEHWLFAVGPHGVDTAVNPLDLEPLTRFHPTFPVEIRPF